MVVAKKLQLVKIKITTNYLHDCIKYFDMNRIFYVLFKKGWKFA